jgi:hypothetical protein
MTQSVRDTITSSLLNFLMFLLADTPPYAYVSGARKTTCRFPFLIFYTLEAANRFV